MASPDAVATAVNDTAGTSIVINKPSGVVQGDVLVAGISLGIAGTDDTVTPPSGWIPAYQNATASNANRTAAYSKVAGASEPSTYTWSWNNSMRSAGFIQRVTDADAIEGSAGAIGANSDPDPPPYTPGSSQAYLIYVVAGISTKSTGWAPPANYTQQTALSTSGGGPHSQHASISAATRILTTGSQEDPGAFNAPLTTEWVAVTAFVQPLQVSGSSGSLDQVLDDASASSAGIVSISGTSSSQTEAVVSSGQGSVSVGGLLSAVLGDVGLASVGDLAVDGAASVSLEGAVLGSTGSGVNETTGVLSAILEAAGIESAGVAEVSGIAVRSLGDASISSDGLIVVVATLSKFLGGAGLSSLASALVSAVSDISLADALLDATSQSAGSHTGSLDLALGGAGLEASAAVLVGASASGTLAGALFEGIGEVYITGNAAPALANAVLYSKSVGPYVVGYMGEVYIGGADIWDDIARPTIIPDSERHPVMRSHEGPGARMKS